MSKEKSAQSESESDWEVVESDQEKGGYSFSSPTSTNAQVKPNQEQPKNKSDIFAKILNEVGDYYTKPENYVNPALRLQFGHIPQLSEDIWEMLKNAPEKFSKMLESAPEEIEGFLDHPERRSQNITTGLSKMGHGLLNTPGNSLDYMVKNGGLPDYLKGSIPTQKEHDFHGASAEFFGDLFGDVEERRKKKPGDELLTGLIEHSQELMGLPGLVKASVPAILKGAQLTRKAARISGDKLAQSANWSAEKASKAIKSAQRQIGMEGPIVENMVSQLAPEEIKKTLAALKAGKNEGIHLTPAEASGNPFLKEMEVEASSSPAGRKEMHDFKEKRKAETERAINDFVDDISTNTEKAPEKIRTVSNEILDEAKADRIKRSEPFYKASERDVVSDTQFKNYNRDPVLRKAFEQMEKDPAFVRATKGFAPGSIKRIDEVKKWLWDKAEHLRAKGQTNAASQYDSARRKLLLSADKASPNYKKAREIYSQDTPGIQKLQDSPLGKIAQFEDAELSKLSDTLFNPKETNPQVFRDVQKQIMNHSPQAWYDIVAYDVKKKLNASTLFQKGNYSEAFYKQLAANPELYRMYSEALKFNKPLQKRFKNYVAAFENMETKFKMPSKREPNALDIINKPMKGAYNALEYFKHNKIREIKTKGDKFSEFLKELE